MSRFERCERRDDAAVHVLGALPEHEAHDFALHLRGCEDCLRQVDELRFVVDALPMSAPMVPPPAHLKDRIMSVVAAEAQLLRAAGPDADRPAEPARRSRWFAGWRPRGLLALRPLPAAALAAVLLALGVGTGVVVQGAEPDPRLVTASVDAVGAKGTLRIADGVAQLSVSNLPAPPEGRIYQVWLDRADDRLPPEPTDVLFGVNHRGSASVSVPGDLEDYDAVLVTAEPLGGSASPTQLAPVLSAELS